MIPGHRDFCLLRHCGHTLPSVRDTLGSQTDAVDVFGYFRSPHAPQAVDVKTSQSNIAVTPSRGSVALG